MKLLIRESNGEMVMEFPDDLLEAMDLKEGDDIYWEQQENGNWLITKKPTSKNEPEDNDNEY